MKNPEELFRLIASENPWWLGQKIEVPEIRRDEFEKIQETLKEKRITAILGPRRVGKTTLMKQLISELLDKKNIDPLHIIYISLDDPAFTLYSEKPIDDVLELYRENVLKQEQISEKTYFFIDEIQHSELWEQWIKRYYDQGLNIKFIISGSSSTHIAKKSKESLLGRIFEFEIYPLNFSQFVRFSNKTIHLENKLLRWIKGKGLGLSRLELLKHEKSMKPLFHKFALVGGFPEWFEIENLEKWQERLVSDILRKAIYRDITLLYNVRIPENLEKLLLIIAKNTGSTLSNLSLSKNLDMDLESVSNYLQYLKSAFLIYESLIFSESVAKQMRANKKYYVVDSGLRNALLRIKSLVDMKDEYGAVVESIVHSHCRMAFKNVYYWKKDEVDIVIRVDDTILPVEVKYKTSIEKNDVKNIIRFMDRFNLQKGILVTKDLLKEEKFRTENRKQTTILYIPAWLFLLVL
jgi:hypothetical protein